MWQNVVEAMEFTLLFEIKIIFKKKWFLTFCIYIRYNTLFCSWFSLLKGVKERPLKLFGWSLYVLFLITSHQLLGQLSFSKIVVFSISFIARPSHEATRVNNLIIIFVKTSFSF
jgi:hypothetical protein